MSKENTINEAVNKAVNEAVNEVLMDEDTGKEFTSGIEAAQDAEFFNDCFNYENSIREYADTILIINATIKNLEEAQLYVEQCDGSLDIRMATDALSETRKRVIEDLLHYTCDVVNEIMEAKE